MTSKFRGIVLLLVSVSMVHGVGATAIAAGGGMIVSHVVVSPADTSLALVRDDQPALKKSAPDAPPSYVSSEGYVTGRVLIAAIERAGRDLTREKLIGAFDGISGLDLGGMSFSFSVGFRRMR